MDNLELFEYMENEFPELEPMDVFRQMFPKGTFAMSSQRNDKGYPLHGAVLEKRDMDGAEAKPQSVKFWDELTELNRAIKKRDRDVHLYPVGFSGKGVKDKNATLFFGFVLDLDYLVPKYGISSLFSQVKVGVQPMPTIVSCSGGGLHLYYLLKEPLRCNRSTVERLKILRACLTRRLWNQYVTVAYKNPQIENVFQPMRAVGSRTKSGGTVRGFQTGDKVTIDYLLTFLPDAVSQLEELAKQEEADRLKRTPLDVAKLLWPEWYEHRIVNKEPKWTFTAKRYFYDYWLRTISSGGAIVGNRYWCLFFLAVIGKKCGIELSEVERDAWSLFSVFEAMTTNPKDKFKKGDVRDALTGYDNRFKFIKKRTIEERTGLKFKEPKYQRRKRKRLETDEERYERLARARESRDRRRAELGLKPWNVKETKESAVVQWRRYHPGGNKKECAEELGVSLPTVYKYWNCGQDRLGEVAKRLFDVDELEIVKGMAKTVIDEYWSNMLAEYIENHVDEIRQNPEKRKLVNEMYTLLEGRVKEILEGGEADE